ncbi:MAG: acetoin utilization protein AcuC [Anaerolineae bacterium]|nr:acetoin utilization protein AcuC [Anaerolineae bacterium]
MRRTTLISSPALWAHGHGASHPLRPERLRMTYELLQAVGAFDGAESEVRAPVPATDDELALWHSPTYIDAVRRLGAGDRDVLAWRYNFGPGDNPVFPGMYESEALKAGASLMAARLVAEGEVDVAFSYSGGLHHAMPGRASGFCVFNDAAIAIQWLAARGLRVLYVDIDAHHGDGVQAAFYDSDRVMTISLHESGEYLFPGTGFVDETGSEDGRGYSVNVPLLPYTGDEVYLWAFMQVVPPLAAQMAPDVLVTQLGADAHFGDPLAHLALTTDAYTHMLETFAGLGLPWVALGGGGYNVHTVARVWTLAYGYMRGEPFDDPIPSSYAAQYGDPWLHDHEGPQIGARETERARGYAARQVASLRQALRRTWPGL